MENKPKNPIGRPRKISSPEEMDRLVDSYIDMCRKSDTPITLTGMILALGLSSRESFDEYRNYEGFSDSVKRAKLMIEHQYEIRLNSGQPTGPIFALKNFGWVDRQDIDHKSSDGTMTPKAPVYKIVSD